MGLDSYWVNPVKVNPDDKYEVKHLVFDPPIRLVGGLVSGHGEGSFRGKV